MRSIGGTEWASYRPLTCELAGVAPGRRILDLGCGLGEDAFAMARQVGDQGEVVGVDPDESLIAQAQRRAQEANLPVRFASASATQLPFPSSHFDGARAVHLFQRLPDPEAALAELVRVVRPGAPIVVADPDYGSAVLDADRPAVADQVLTSLYAHLPNPWSGRRLRGMFDRANIRDILVHVEYFPISLSHLKADRLSQTLDTMVGQQLLTKDEADRFFQDLEERSASGRFFGGFSFFIVAGHKATDEK